MRKQRVLIEFLNFDDRLENNDSDDSEDERVGRNRGGNGGGGDSGNNEESKMSSIEEESKSLSEIEKSRLSKSRSESEIMRKSKAEKEAEEIEDQMNALNKSRMNQNKSILDNRELDERGMEELRKMEANQMRLEIERNAEIERLTKLRAELKANLEASELSKQKMELDRLAAREKVKEERLKKQMELYSIGGPARVYLDLKGRNRSILNQVERDKLDLQILEVENLMDKRLNEYGEVMSEEEMYAKDLGTYNTMGGRIAAIESVKKSMLRMPALKDKYENDIKRINEVYDYEEKKGAKKVEEEKKSEIFVRNDMEEEIKENQVQVYSELYSNMFKGKKKTIIEKTMNTRYFSFDSFDESKELMCNEPDAVFVEMIDLSKSRIDLELRTNKKKDGLESKAVAAFLAKVVTLKDQQIDQLDKMLDAPGVKFDMDNLVIKEEQKLVRYGKPYTAEDMFRRFLYFQFVEEMFDDILSVCCYRFKNLRDFYDSIMARIYRYIKKHDIPTNLFLLIVTFYLKLHSVLLLSSARLKHEIFLNNWEVTLLSEPNMYQFFCANIPYFDYAFDMLEIDIHANLVCLFYADVRYSVYNYKVTFLDNGDYKFDLEGFKVTIPYGINRANCPNNKEWFLNYLNKEFTIEDYVYLNTNKMIDTQQSYFEYFDFYKKKSSMVYRYYYKESKLMESLDGKTWNNAILSGMYNKQFLSNFYNFAQ